jgi:lipid-A-disaccharide synthase
LRETVAKLRQKYPHAEFRVPIASTLPPALVESELRDPSIKLESTRAREILAWADAALVASGTATLETALVGTPFCLYYKLSRSSAFYYQRIRRYKGFLGMPNLLQGKEVVRELFQQKATSENLALE